MRESKSTSGKLATYLPGIALALVVTVAAYVRIRLLQVPLERDEGEYAYMGQLLLDGIPPYLHAYSMKLPGVSVVYALFMALFGQNPAGVHLGLLVVNGVSVALLFLLAQRLFDRETAFLTSASFALLSLSKTVYGFFAHATNFIVLFALAGFVLLLRALDRGRIPPLLASGLCFGLAFTMKQPAVFLIIFAFLYIFWRGRISSKQGERVSLKGLAFFILGAALPYGLIILWVLRGGAFDNFWFWTVTYAREYTSSLPLGEGLQALTHNFAVIFKPNVLLWLLACAGGVMLLAGKGRCTNRPFVAGFFLFSFLAVTPGLYFRWHYFILVLPAAALLVGGAATAIADLLPRSGEGAPWLRQLAPSLVVLTAIGYGFYKERECFFQLTPEEVIYSTYRKSPFAAAPDIGRYLREHTADGDRIAVIGSEPEIYFYAGRTSATGHIYMYSLMENQPHAERMQGELIREVELSRPKYCVFVDLQFSWLETPSSPRLIFEWFDRYVREHYEQVGVIDLHDDASFLFWDAEAAKRTPVPNGGIVVYRRKA